MFRYFSIIDFLGKRPNLWISGNQKHKTVIGGIFSIIVGILIIFVISYFFNNLISRRNFTVFNVENFDENQSGDVSNMKLAIGLTGPDGLYLPNQDKLFYMKAKIFHYYPSINNGKFVMALNITDVQLERCNLEKHFGDSRVYDIWKTRYSFGLESLFCIVPGQNVVIQKVFSNPDFKQLVFWYQRCKNDSVTKDCLPQNEIEETLSNIYIGLRIENIYFDHNDYLNPDKKFVTQEGFPASSSVVKETGIRIKNVEYDTDDNYILTSSDPKIYPIYYEKYENIAILKEDIRSPGSFASFSVSYGRFTTKIFRKYYKFQNMLADLGALVKGIITVFILINNYISDHVFYTDIIQKSLASLEAIGIEEYWKDNQDKINIKKEFNDVNENLRQLDIIKNDIPASMSIQDKSARTELKPVIRSNLKNNDAEKEKYSISNIIKMGSLLLIPKFLMNKMSKRKNEIFNRIRHRIKEQLDLINIFSKFNIVDKIQYIISGNAGRNILEDSVNPYNFNDEKYLCSTNIVKIRQNIIKNFKEEYSE